MYICIYIHIYIHIYIRINIYIYICTHVYTHVYIYAYLNIYVYIYTHIYIHIYTCKCAFQSFYTHRYKYTCTHTELQHVQRSRRAANKRNNFCHAKPCNLVAIDLHQHITHIHAPISEGAAIGIDFDDNEGQYRVASRRHDNPYSAQPYPVRKIERESERGMGRQGANTKRTRGG